MKMTTLSIHESLSINSFCCHAGPDPASRMFRRDWIPAFAGMTILTEAAIYKRTLMKKS